MTIVNMIDTIAEWVRTEVCGEIKLKKEPKLDAMNMASYRYELVHPKVWVLYRPTPDTLTLYEYDCPCIVIQPLKIEYDHASGNITDAVIRLCCVTWSPGEHMPDNYELDDAQLPPGRLGIYRQSGGESFRPDDEGWRDAYNLSDLILGKLFHTESIGSLKISKEHEIEASPFTEERVLQYFYPEYFMRVDIHFFTQEPPVKNRTVTELL